MTYAPIDRHDPCDTALRFVDDFADDTPSGAVDGTRTDGGVVRHVKDVEGVIGIDHGALRIRPMIDQRWGRANLTYGPFDRCDGLLFATLLLNGHNTSQSEQLSDRLKGRLIQWLHGHTTGRRNMLRRAGQWLRYPRKRNMIRQVRSWRHMDRFDFEPLDENLAIGWFPDGDLGPPEPRGALFVMHAAKGDNGELWARVGTNFLPVASGVQNVPMCYAVILRETGAAYYLASLPSANAAAPFPRFRPLAIDSSDGDQSLVAGLHQAVLGQVGFRVDTRVYGVQAEPVERLATWFGTAHAADRLAGSGPLDDRTATVGGRWRDVDGAFVLSETGAVATGAGGVAVLRSGIDAGLVHVNVSRGEGRGAGGLIVRWRDDRRYVRLDMSDSATRLIAVDGDAEADLATDTSHVLAPNDRASVQILEEGDALRVAVDGQLLFDGPVTVAGGPGTGAGIHAAPGCDMIFDSFEAHPVEVDLSDEIRLPEPWLDRGGDVVVADDFAGEGERDLAGRRTPYGAMPWERSKGAGRILVGSGRAVVDASVERPNPGETIYTVPWDPGRLVDVSVDVTPPGMGRGEGQRGRGGLVLWQDARNYLVVSMYVDDTYDGASIAIFSHLDGFEDIYDAVWSMVGKKIYWGRRHRLRAVSDGEHVLICIGDEPVLYRAISDLFPGRAAMRLTKVGIVVNWEWGDDTGTVFNDFSVRAGGPTS